MRLIFLLALTALPAAARADANPDFDPSTICASVYQPVCAAKAGATKTFPNACMAARVGFTPVAHGACGSTASVLPRFCAKQYASVCGERNGVRRQF